MKVRRNGVFGSSSNLFLLDYSGRNALADLRRVSYTVGNDGFQINGTRNLAGNVCPDLPSMFFHRKITWISSLVIFCQRSFE